MTFLRTLGSYEECALELLLYKVLVLVSQVDKLSSLYRWRGVLASDMVQDFFPVLLPYRVINVAMC